VEVVIRNEWDFSAVRDECVIISGTVSEFDIRQ